MFVVEGMDNVCYKRDWCQLFSLVLASLDNMSVLTFSGQGMCCMETHSKTDCITFRTT